MLYENKILIKSAFSINKEKFNGALNPVFTRKKKLRKANKIIRVTKLYEMAFFDKIRQASLLYKVYIKKKFLTSVEA